MWPADSQTLAATGSVQRKPVPAHPRTSQTSKTFFCFPTYIRNLVQAQFFYFLEYLCIQMVLLSHFYHNTVIPMSEQQQFFCAAQSCHGLARSRVADVVAAKKNCRTIRTGINSTAQSCTCTNLSSTVRASEIHLVKDNPNVRKIRKICPSDGLFLNFGQKCVHVRWKIGEY